jgi:magnesium chelatase family protein
MSGYARAWSIGLLGLEGTPVRVEAHMAAGLAKFTLIGLPDSVLSEARDRVRAATMNSAVPWPSSVLTVSLSPAWLPKQGSGFDLAVAVAVLRAAGAVDAAAMPAAVFLAELGLDGRVRPIRGVLPCVLAAARAGLSPVFVAEANAAEAAQVPGVEVTALRSLRHLVALATGRQAPGDPPEDDPPGGVGDGLRRTFGSHAGAAGPGGLNGPHDPHRPDAPPGPPPDLAEVLGQYEARRALEISAAGRHHLFLCGAPGAGKTMLAERLPGIMPPLGLEASLEVSAIHSLSGSLGPARPLISTPPFCCVHHTATVAAMVGGGSGQVRPGAISRAHHGVLFLDEAPEFGRAVLDALREPIESGRVEIARAGATARFPARFLMVAAANPCPCGRARTEQAADCSCTPRQRVSYLGRISGPLFDRIDLRVDVAPVGPAELLDAARGGTAGENTQTVADRVLAARDRAGHRLADTPWTCNADVPGHVLRNTWRLPAEALECAHRALRAGALTARGLDRVVRVAWTVADLAGLSRPDQTCVDTALGLRLGAYLPSIA